MLVALSALFVSLIAPLASSQTSLAPANPPEDDIRTARLTVSPADEPRESLKYLLLPGFLDRKPGNAALHYHRAIAMMQNTNSDKDQQTISDWLEMPLAKIPLKDARKLLDGYQATLDEIHMAARRDECDWELPVRESKDPIGILLPEIQSMRSLARLTCLKVRVEIAEGKIDEAVETLQTQLAMGRHVAEAPFLVSGLVGIAMHGMAFEQANALMEQPDCPNLYWALTALPNPPIDLRGAFEAEMELVYMMFPVLRDVPTDPRSLEYWRGFLDQMANQWALYASNGQMEASHARVIVAGLALVGYPRARDSLIAQGRSREEVEALPVAQVVLLYTSQTFNEFRDRMFRWFPLPYWEAEKGMDEAEQFLKAESWRREIVPVASLLLPAIQAAKSAEVRNAQEVAMLRTVEAVRIHAARHDGQLPDRLDEVTEVPMPIDPYTGKPVAYRRDGRTVVLESMVLPDGRSDHRVRRYIVTFREK